MIKKINELITMPEKTWQPEADGLECPRETGIGNKKIKIEIDVDALTAAIALAQDKIIKISEIKEGV